MYSSCDELGICTLGNKGGQRDNVMFNGIYLWFISNKINVFNNIRQPRIFSDTTSPPNKC